MTAREYLSQVRLYDIRLHQLQEQYNRLRADASGMRSVGINPDKVQGSGDGDPMARTVSEFVDLEERIRKLFGDLFRLRSKIIGEIQQMDDPRYEQVLYYRYISFFPLFKIADVMRKPDGEPYSHQYIRRLHFEALLAFQNKFL